MALRNALLTTQVMHARQRPKANRFNYRVYYFCLSPSNWPLLKKTGLVSLESFNLFSLRARDHGRSKSPEDWIRQLLAEHNITAADGEIVLMTMPRILGYAFNPVSFWFCLDKHGRLRAVLADVSNTFGERHAYLLYHDDQRPIKRDDQLTSKKIFHVSPFIEVTGSYVFRFVYGPEAIGVWIDHYDNEGLLLVTSVTGKRRELNRAALLRCFFGYPLVTLKVILLIHYQALRLFFKGMRYHRKPAPPTMEVSR